MATKIGLVRRLDTGEVIRVVYPLDSEPNSVLDQSQWLTMGFEHLTCKFEMLKFDKHDPRISEFVNGVMGTPKVV